MSDAPAWLEELLALHGIQMATMDYPRRWVCYCGDESDSHRAHIVDVIWAGLKEHNVIPDPFSMRSGGQIEPRVIPSRTTDPVTSHTAAAAVTVKAGTQRARLLKAFEWVEDYEVGKFNKGNLTDEEAMELADGVDPRSEYSKRCSELREAGLIEPTGETRTGASGHQRIVSRITEAGRKVVQGL